MRIGFKSCMINQMFEPKSRFSFHTINCFDKGTNKFDDKGLYVLVLQTPLPLVSVHLNMYLFLYSVF